MVKGEGMFANRPGAKRKMVYLGRDENRKPRYMQRSHFVWNEHHPDDPILPGQHIHHIDGNRQNDEPSNLQKLAAADHQRLHGDQNRREPKVCPVCGNEFHTAYLFRQTCCSNQCAAILRQRKRDERHA